MLFSANIVLLFQYLSIFQMIIPFMFNAKYILLQLSEQCLPIITMTKGLLNVCVFDLLKVPFL